MNAFPTPPLGLAVAIALALTTPGLAARDPASGSRAANSTTPDPATLDTVEVTADPLPSYQGRWRIDAPTIERLPRGNGDLASLLRLNPNVQLDDASRSQRTPGEIRPAEISINGAPFYQNRFAMDGTSITNDLDPVSSNPNHYADPPSATQGLALDTSLIGTLDVYDSNVPARFGGFNGGVVDAYTHRANDRLQGRVVLRHTRDDWADNLVSLAAC
jgi:hypothetical protein